MITKSAVNLEEESCQSMNLLLPDGVPLERQRARFIVRVYRADGLPKMNSSIVANVKKAFTGEIKDLVDPYVQVSFAGLTGKTSVKKNNYAPVWNEQLVFTEMFPPLCQRIKLQLRDNDPVNNTVIGTHFIDLKTISNDGEKGFLPTFGPTFVHLYGSTRDYSLIDEHSNLNTGLGEGVSYRARLLIAIRTEITDNIDLAPSEVEVEPTFPINETSYGKNEEYFMFATIIDATMIDKKLGDKPLFFEISIGNAGNSLDGHNETSKDASESDSDENLECVTTSPPSWQSTTSPAKPMTNDHIYHFLPYWDDKPCMHVRSVWPDYRRRMYNSNIIARIVDKLVSNISKYNFLKNIPQEEGLSEVHSLSEVEDASTERTLKNVLEELSMGCSRFVSITKGNGSGAGLGKTKLDKERIKLCQREIPQQSLPDIFVWVISSGKRTAYQRIPARDLIYSIVDEECGRDCGRLPGKRGMGPSGWTIQAKLQIYMWLGLIKHKKNFVNGLPKGYEVSHEIKNAERPRALPPSVIHYTEKHSFQLRAHMYQARSLIGSDASGLSDPFARVVIGEYCKVTQVIDETLSPTWDELLIFDEILIYGTKEDIKSDPPSIIIEIFDQDKVGKSEFIGRTVAKPHVKLAEEPYQKPNFPPSLEWYELTRGPDHAGELLATFELLQMVETTIETDIGPMLPVPRGIRPTLAKYRIEVLFWGLRDLKRVHLMTVDKPRVDIECAGHILYSSVIQNAKKNPNFGTPVKFLELELPEQELYRPPLTIRAVDCRSFGRYTLVGTHMINSIHKYMYVPMTKREREAEERKKSLQQLQSDFNGTGQPTTKKELKTEANKKRKQSLSEDADNDESSRDWWTKYFASVEAMIEESKEARKEMAQMQSQQNGTLPIYLDDNQAAAAGTATLQESKRELSWTGSEKSVEKKKHTLKGASQAAKLVARLSPKSMRRKKEQQTALMKIYPNELEMQTDYNGFKEWLQTFELYRGKKTGDDLEDESRVVGTFKGAIKVYKWPLPKDIEDHTIMGFDPQYGFFQGLPNNDPIHVLVRVYIVKANDLHPMDLNGKADPCFEIEATFPQDSMLTVQILDWDLVGSDDMIGETRIDLENRFYSRHRATCGIARKYEDNGKVKVGRQTFFLQVEDSDCNMNTKGLEEHMALAVLHRWHEFPRIGCQLVPEHIETRPLYNPEKPGIEQGKLEMWVDMFPMDMPLPGPPLDISPRKPKSYELRIIIWNTDEVVLEDDAFFTGEKMSDIYGKVEAELHLLSHEESEKNPAGLGRNEPDPLDKPNRPDASFMWFLNPLKSIRYIVWHNYKWAIIKVLAVLALAIVLLLFFYSVPGYTVKKLLGA
ncbi:Otoferlin [Blattella germanica]|nr:Otoferlin [Blattella germanica]